MHFTLNLNIFQLIIEILYADEIISADVLVFQLELW